jgi:D-lactate dehydrogenase (cytochrome)
LSTDALSGIKVYAPDDLVITVGAGTSLREIQTFLAQHGQQLTLASPWPDATIGGIVATNINAPLRMRYGAIRDLVLCMTVALPDGRVIRTGRPIVKNVAGYDLTKAFIGSHGTLGLLCDISLKISAQPRQQCTLLIHAETIEQGMQAGQQLLQVALNASAIILGKSEALHAFGLLPDTIQSKYVLVYTTEGMPQDVQAEVAQARDLLTTLQISSILETEQTNGSQIWATTLQATNKQRMLVRAGVPIKDLPTYMNECAALIDTSSWVVDIANGFVYAMYESVDESGPLVTITSWLNTLRTLALKLGGYAIVLDMPISTTSELIPDNIDRWGYHPASFSLMQRLKARWDGENILNPGVFLVN